VEKQRPVIYNLHQTTNGSVSTGVIGSTERRRLADRACTLQKEFACVRVEKERPIDADHDRRRLCPEDCNDITYSTIIFGNPLDIGTTSSHLPSDWDDEKEKRLKRFQV